MSNEREELTGILKRVVWSSSDPKKPYTIATLHDPNLKPNEDPFHPGARQNEITVKGVPPSTGMVSGMAYLLRGKWITDEKYGRQFLFDSATEKPAATRHGVVEYLRRYAPYVGDATAHAIVDKFGIDRAIDVLKSDPSAISAAIRGFTLDKARLASEALVKAQKFQETRVALLDLLSGKGFSEASMDACVKHWGVHAPQVVRRDPFKMMLKRVPQAGFMKCDKLWHEFGLPADKLKRQVMAAWYHLKSDQSGSTWHAKEDVIRTVRGLITGNARPEQAIAIAIRAKRLIQTERNGRLWVAEVKKAEDEDLIAEKVCKLMSIVAA